MCRQYGLLIGCLMLLVATGSTSHAQSDETAVVDISRTIAAATEQLMQSETAEERERFESIIEAGLEELRRIAGVRGILEQILLEERSYVTMSAVAYARYLVDPASVDAAVSELVRQMNRQAFTGRMLAQKLIIAIGEPALSVLVRHLNNSMIIHVIGDMGENAGAAVPALREIAVEGNVEAARALAKIGSDEAVEAALPILIEAAQHPRSPYAKMAVISLGELGPGAAEAIPAVRSALQAADPDTRVYAAVALSELGDVESSVQALADLVGDEEIHARHLAIRTLGALGVEGRPAIPALTEVLLDERSQRLGDRVLAAQALLDIDPTDEMVRAALTRAAEQPSLRSLMAREGLVRQ